MIRETNIAVGTKNGAGPKPCRCNIAGGTTIGGRSHGRSARSKDASLIAEGVSFSVHLVHILATMLR